MTNFSGEKNEIDFVHRQGDFPKNVLNMKSLKIAFYAIRSEVELLQFDLFLT